MIDRAGGDDTTSDRAAPPRRPDKGSRRLLAWAFGISAVLHLVGIALYPIFFDGLRPESVSFPVSASTDALDGVEVITLVELDEEEADTREPPEEPLEAIDPTAPVGAIDLPDLSAPVEIDLPPPGPTAAERLRPRLTDARIWAPLDRALGELTPAHREELLASGRLQEWYDSVLVAEEAERALTDWTFTDEGGKRWGVADGRVYLGDFSLPLPFDFGVNPANREEVNMRLYQFDEIQRQGRQMELRDSWRERSEAIRARRDLERAAADSLRRPGG
jgi:hypothetical protein